MPAKDVRPTDPVSPEEIYQVLCGSASQDAEILKTSSEALRDYLGRPGTYEQLYSIASEKSNVPLDVRRMAIIQFKNGTSGGVWRNRRLFTEESRANIRARSMMLLHEEDNIIADCNALIIAKIARNDFPTPWTSLVSDLMAIMQVEIERYLSNPAGANTSDTLVLRRTLRVLDRAVKEISSLKMLNGIRAMAQLANALYSSLTSYYHRFSVLLCTSLTPETLVDHLLHQACGELVEVSHMVFKPCVKIIAWLWPRAGQKEYSAVSETVLAFSQSSFQLVQQLFDLRKQLILTLCRDSSESVTPSVALLPTIPLSAIKTIHQLTRHLRLYGKMFKKMQQVDARKFVEIPRANELVQYYWGEVVKATGGPPELLLDSPEAVYPVRLLVQGMVLFRECLLAWSRKGKGDNPTEILSEQFVQEAVHILLIRFMPLAPTDLEKWVIDPEEWFNEEEKEGDAWEFDLRPCSERLLVMLCNHYQQYVVPFLVKTFAEVLATSTDNVAHILQKEAVYCAIGRCAGRLQGILDFDDWLQKHLVIEAQQSNPDYRIIKRRIAWVIGRWHIEQCSVQSKAQIWEVLRHLLRDRGTGSDFVVRLTAAEAIRECVDTLEFELSIFLPFLRDFVAELLQLVFEADTVEGKKRLIKTINVVIERAEINIVPFIDVITSTLPQLWHAVEEEVILKANLIVMVTHLVQATKEQSSSFLNTIISLVQESFDPKTRLQLDEDGLVLWQAAIRNTISLDNPLKDGPAYIDMFPHATTLVKENLDLLGTTLTIIQSYILLDGPKVISAYGEKLFEALASALSRAVQANVKDVILTVNLIAQAIPPIQYVEAMHRSGLFAALVKAVIDDKAPATMLTEHIYVFARIALGDPTIFGQLVAASAPSLNMPETQVIEGVLDQWWSKFDNMAEPRQRKLAAMGIACWVSTARPEVLGRLDTEIFNLWLDVFGELKEALADSSPENTRSPLKLFWLNSSEHLPPLPPGAKGTVEENRWRELFLRDPITTQKLTVFVREQLQQAEMKCGGTDAFRAKYLDKADPTVLDQLTTELMSGN